MLLSLLLTTIALAQNAPQQRLELRDPTFHKVLHKNTSLECRILGQPNMGFILERGDGDDIKIFVINDNKNEGEKTAFTATMQTQHYAGLHMKHFRRSGQWGSYIEFVIFSKIRADHGYQLPGTMLITSSEFSKGADGQEKEDLYPDGVQRLGCKPPLQR